MKRSAIVIGGGIVGVCSALELQKTGNGVISVSYTHLTLPTKA